MEIDGLLSANSEKPGSRPEKTVYSITDKGISLFSDMLSDLLNFGFRPTFESFLSGLMEETKEELLFKDRRIKLVLTPFEILTIRVR